MNRKLSTLAGLAAVTLLAAGCSQAPEAGDGAGDKGAANTLRIGNFIDLTSWDTGIADIGFNAPYLSAIYDPLIAIDGAGQPQPALAEEWEISDDFLTITMDLRDDAKFSDGEVFNADAALANLEYLKTGTVSREAYLNVDSFAAVDEDTIEIHLAKRDDRLLYFMGLGRSYMASPASLKAGNLAEAPVGSGPYTLSDTTVPGSEYNFDHVDGHWTGDTFPYKSLTVMPMQDPTALNNALAAGQVDMIYGDATTVEMAKQNDWNIASQVASWVGLRINDHTGDDVKALGDTRVRQAMAYAFDGAAMLKNIGQGLGEDTNQFFAYGFAGHDPEIDKKYEYNLDKAKELMAEAGYADGFDVKMPMAPSFQAWQPTVDQVFGELGIRVTWDEYQYADYQSNAGTYPMFISVLAVDSNPVAAIARQLTVPQWYMPEPDISKFPKLQGLVDEALTAAPGDAQNAKIRELNAALIDEAWYIVWYQANNTYASVADVEVTPVTGMMFPTLRQIQPKN